jgi:replicative DNA helicase
MSALDRTTTNGHDRGFDGPMTPPQNLEAEQSVLGAVLLSDTALPALIIDERLQPHDFYREGHGRIFAAMLELHGAGEPVDALTLVEHLKQSGQLESVGGRPGDRPPRGRGAERRQRPQYAKIVRDNAMLRRLVRRRSRSSRRSTPTRRLRASSWTSPSARSSRSPTSDRRKDFQPIQDVLNAELAKLEIQSREGTSMTGSRRASRPSTRSRAASSRGT